MLDTEAFLNIAGIGLEIMGFIFMLRATGVIEALMRIELLTGTVRKPSYIQNPKLNKVGIYLIISGLALQIFAILLNV